MKFTRSISILLTLAALTAATARSFAAEEADRQFRFAKGLYARGQWDAAAAEFRTLLKQHPSGPDADDARFYLGEALVQTGRFLESVEYFEVYVAANPDGEHSRQALFRIGECLFLGDRPERAASRLAAFSAAYPDQPLNALALTYRGTIALDQKDAQAAAVLLQQGLDRFPQASSRDECRMGLGRALEALGRTDEAQRYFLALASKPSSPRAQEAQYRLGSLQYNRAEYASAIETFSRFEAVSLDNRWAAAAMLGQGWALVKLDRHADAARLFRRLVDHDGVGIEAKNLSGNHGECLPRAEMVRIDDGFRIGAKYWLGLCQKAQHEWTAAADTFLEVAQWLAPRQASQQADGKVTETAALFHAGDCLLAADKLDQARKHFSRAIKAGKADDPWLDDARRAAVQTLVRLEEYEPAEQAVEQFLTNHPDSPLAVNVLRLLVRCQLEQEQYVDAERTLCRIENRRDPSAENHQDEYLLALAYAGQERFGQALTTVGPVVEQADGTLAADARLTEGSLLMRLGRFEEAITSLDSLTAANNTQAVALAAVCHAKLGHFAEARRFYTRAVADSPQWDTAEQIAEAAFDAEQYEEAESLYRELIEGDTDSTQRARALLGLARCRFHRADYENAERMIGDFFDLGSKTDYAAEATFLRGRTLSRLGRHEAACEQFIRVIERHADSEYRAAALWQAAQLHEQLGQPAPAVTLYHTIADIVPDHPQKAGALYNLAWIHRQQGKTDEAIVLFRRLLAEHRDSPYWGHAAMTVATHELEAGRTAQAEAVIEELLDEQHGEPLRDRALYLAGQIAFAAEHWHQARGRFEQMIEEHAQSDLAAMAAFGAAEAAFRAQDADAIDRFEQLPQDAQGLSESMRATARMRLAQLYAEAQRWTDAMRTAESFALDHPDFPQQYEIDYVLGRCLAARALLAEARAAYQKVLTSPAGELTETAAKSQLMIGESFFHQKRYDQAFRAYMQVEILYDYPDLQAAALLQAGKCRQLAGRTDAAEKLYQQVLTNYPKSQAAEQVALPLRSEK